MYASIVVVRLPDCRIQERRSFALTNAAGLGGKSTPVMLSIVRMLHTNVSVATVNAFFIPMATKEENIDGLFPTTSNETFQTDNIEIKEFAQIIEKNKKTHNTSTNTPGNHSDKKIPEIIKKDIEITYNNVIGNIQALLKDENYIPPEGEENKEEGEEGEEGEENKVMTDDMIKRLRKRG